MMIDEIGIDRIVALYALCSVEYRSVEEAMAFIFGTGDDNEPRQHPFFGYQEDGYIAPSFDNEAVSPPL